MLGYSIWRMVSSLRGEGCGHEVGPDSGGVWGIFLWKLITQDMLSVSRWCEVAAGSGSLQRSNIFLVSSSSGEEG